MPKDLRGSCAPVSAQPGVRVLPPGAITGLPDTFTHAFAQTEDIGFFEGALAGKSRRLLSLERDSILTQDSIPPSGSPGDP